jgi:hypothetical protein
MSVHTAWDTSDGNSTVASVTTTTSSDLQLYKSKPSIILAVLNILIWIVFVIGRCCCLDRKQPKFGTTVAPLGSHSSDLPVHLSSTDWPVRLRWLSRTTVFSGSPTTGPS